MFISHFKCKRSITILNIACGALGPMSPPQHLHWVIVCDSDINVLILRIAYCRNDIILIEQITVEYEHTLNP